MALPSTWFTGSHPAREGWMPSCVAVWRHIFTKVFDKTKRRLGNGSFVFLTRKTEADRERFVLNDVPRGS